MQGHEVGALDVWIGIGRRLGGDLGIVFWTERGLNWKREIRLEVEPSHGQRCGWRRVHCAGKLEEGDEEREGRVKDRQTRDRGQNRVGRDRGQIRVGRDRGQISVGRQVPRGSTERIRHGFRHWIQQTGNGHLFRHAKNKERKIKTTINLFALWPRALIDGIASSIVPPSPMSHITLGGIKLYFFSNLNHRWSLLLPIPHRQPSRRLSFRHHHHHYHQKTFSL